VLSKGVIILSDTRQSSTGAKTRHEFSLTFDDRVAPLLSPTARIIVWCVTSTGEVITDTLEVSVNAAFANEVSACILQLIIMMYISARLLFLVLHLVLCLFFVILRYGDSAGNAVEKNSSIFSLIRMSYLPSVL